MLMNHIRRIAVFLTVLIMAAGSLLCSSPVDYSYPDNWAYYGIGEGKDADLFLICPTVDMGTGGNLNMSMDDEKVKANFTGALNMERGIYEDSAVMYAPFYRQIVFPLYLGSEEDMKPYLDIAYDDVSAAFEYYMENIKKSPHLKMAEGEDDTGVIVMFSTEAPEADSSIIVPEGIRTLGINPLNWRTDSTLADRSLNIGACFTDYSGAITGEMPNLTGCYLDEERGTLKAVDIIPEDYSNSLFPDGVYHLYDYQFFFRNLEENVRTRLESWQEAHS